jgi:D-alanyl-D-alanine carboxypeptidase
MTSIKQDQIQRITDQMVNHTSVFGSVIQIEDEEKTFSYLSASGNLKEDNHYFIASVTKLYVTAMILILKNKGLLALDDSMISFFKKGEVDNLHIYKGVDYTKEITIRHLLSNQTGLRDYFYYEVTGSKAVGDLEKKDVAWTFEKAMNRVKTLKPLFKPGQPKKVHYSDTNFKILGEIIEIVTKMTIDQAFDTYLFKPLKLKTTCVFTRETKIEIAPLYFKKLNLNIPNYMASIGAEGGIVSTASEVMIFLKAFFSGFYFPKDEISQLTQNYRMIFIPGQFYFGLGIEKLWIPRFMSFKYPIKNLIGFWGQTGAFAFYDLDTKVYFTGTINQASGFGHGKALMGIIKFIKLYKKERKH